jgi:hypothetical protein
MKYILWVWTFEGTKGTKQLYLLQIAIKHR